jgi:hypothetical protein
MPIPPEGVEPTSVRIAGQAIGNQLKWHEKLGPIQDLCFGIDDSADAIIA